MAGTIAVTEAEEEATARSAVEGVTEVVIEGTTDEKSKNQK